MRLASFFAAFMKFRFSFRTPEHTSGWLGNRFLSFNKITYADCFLSFCGHTALIFLVLSLHIC